MAVNQIALGFSIFRVHTAASVLERASRRLYRWESRVIFMWVLYPRCSNCKQRPRRRLHLQSRERAGSVGRWGGGLLQRKTAGNDKGCKYLPLPGPGSCAELTGPLLGCWKVGGGDLASEVGSGREKRAQEDWGEGGSEGWGGTANNTALIIPWTSARMFLCLL